MPDLRDSFDALRHDLDSTRAPDMLADAFGRAPSKGEPDGPSPWRRAGIIALALVITVASTVFVVRAFDRDQAAPAAKTGVLPYPLAYTGADVPDPHWAHGQLWLMDEAGQRITLASIPGDQTAVPAWSPDGSQIAFAAELDDLGTQIWLINADGTDLHELTQMVPMEGSAINDAPAWSPDGTKIAFNCYNSQGHQLCEVNADGSDNPRMLTGGINVAHDTPPVWLGPNELMFSTSGPPAEGTYTVSLGNGEPTRIGTARPQMTLSPSGDRIAFLCPTGHGYAICTEATDLTGREQVTSPPTDLTAAITDSDSFPAWLPDGRLSFVRESRVFDGFHLYVVDAHGGAPTELANLGNDVRGLGWGPSADQNQTPSPTPQPTESPTPAEAGYWIRFPDSMNVGESGSDGSIELETDLPDGTRYWATGGASGGVQNTCCPPVKDGHIRVPVRNATCYGPVGDAANSGPVEITITVADHFDVIFEGIGVGNLPHQQPQSVLDVLGPHLENLTGDQVQPLPNGGNELVATHTYDWPAPQCGGDPLPMFGGPTCQPAREQLQGDTLDEAMVEVVGALGQARMCEFWGTELTEAAEASHPWDTFSTEWRQWFLYPPKDFTLPKGSSPTSSIHTFSPGQTFASGNDSTPGQGNGFSSLEWRLVRKDGLTSIVDITSNGTPILELTIESLPNYCPDCSSNTVPFWGVTDWRFLDS